MGQIISWISLHKRVVILSIVLIGTLGFWSFLSGKNSHQQPQYQTQQVEKGTLIVSTSASGQVSNANSGAISTQASGVVTNIYVTNGQRVNQGDPIAEIELDQIAKQNNAQASSSYQNAKNNLSSAQQTMYTLHADLFAQNKKFVDLASGGTYTNGDGSPNLANRTLPEFIQAQDTWLAAEAKYKNQQNVVFQAQTALNASWLSYQQSSPIVYAPISGTVTGLSLQVGSVLTNQTSSTGMITSQKIASIKTQAPPTITINLTEVDVPAVKVGNKATITLDAFPGKTFTGQVVAIDTVGTVASGVTTYPTTIKFDTEVPNVFANMSAQANIITNIKDSVLLVPTSAVQTQSGQSSVRILKNGQISRVPIEIGLSSDTKIEIVSGLSEGDTIVTSVNTTTTRTAQPGTQSPFSAFGGRGFGGGGGAVRIRGD